MVNFIVINNVYNACKLININPIFVKYIKVSTDLIFIFYYDNYLETLNLHFIAQFNNISSKSMYQKLLSIEKG